MNPKQRGEKSLNDRSPLLLPSPHLVMPLTANEHSQHTRENQVLPIALAKCVLFREKEKKKQMLQHWARCFHSRGHSVQNLIQKFILSADT